MRRVLGVLLAGSITAAGITAPGAALGEIVTVVVEGQIDEAAPGNRYGVAAADFVSLEVNYDDVQVSATGPTTLNQYALVPDEEGTQLVPKEDDFQLTLRVGTRTFTEEETAAPGPASFGPWATALFFFDGELVGVSFIVHQPQVGEDRVSIHVSGASFTGSNVDGALGHPVFSAPIKGGFFFEDPEPDCANDQDDDGDGLTDFPIDPGCSDDADPSELGANQCDDGQDNDGDGATDVGEDNSCRDALSPSEETECSNGADDDLDGGVDFDGGPDGSGIDFDCVARPFHDSEAAAPPACGLLGIELLVAIGLLRLATGRRGRRSE